MGIINKPNPFTGSTAPQLTWLDADFDALFSEFNGNIEDVNVKANAGIAQSKIANLVTALAALVPLTGATMTGGLGIKCANAVIRLTGTEASAGDFLIIEDAGTLKIYKNAGSFDTPSWTLYFSFNATGAAVAATDIITKAALDAYSTAFGQALRTSDFSLTDVTLVPVTGLSITITTLARRVRLDASVMVTNNGLGSAIDVSFAVDGTVVESSSILASSDDSRLTPIHISYVTPVLTAAAHTFTVVAQSSASSGPAGSPVTIKAAADRPAVFQATELLNA